jgi:hypothetical protein
VAAVAAAAIVARRSGVTLSGQVADALPHPHLRLHRTAEPVPVAEPVSVTAAAAPVAAAPGPVTAAPAERGRPDGLIEDAQRVDGALAAGRKAS